MSTKVFSSVPAQASSARGAVSFDAEEMQMTSKYEARKYAPLMAKFDLDKGKGSGLSFVVLF